MLRRSSAKIAAALREGKLKLSIRAAMLDGISCDIHGCLCCDIHAEDIGMKMQSAVNVYLVEIELRKNTPKMIRSYLCSLNLFLRFCAEKLHVETVEALTSE